MDDLISESVLIRLNEIGVFSVEDFAKVTKKQVKSLKGVGPKTLLEIEYLMSKHKVKFKKEKRISKVPLASRKRLISFLIKEGTRINWGLEMKNAERLLLEYPEDFLFTLKPKVEIRTLNYFFNPYVKQKLHKKYLLWGAKLETPEVERVELQPTKVGEDKVIKKPLTLKDFLS